MKSTTFQLTRRFRILPRKLNVVVLAIIMLANVAYAQTYVNSTSASSTNGTALGVPVAPGSVTAKDNAVGAPDAASTTLFSSGIEAAVIVGTIKVAGTATLVMNFSASIPAGKRTYIRITELSRTGINLDLGDLVNVLGLLNDNVIAVTSNGGATTSQFVKNGAGELFIAVKPTTSYTQLTLKLDFTALLNQLVGLTLGTITMKVDHAVTFDSSPFVPCENLVKFTNSDPEATGVSLTLTDALANPERAIDGIINTTNYSTLQTGSVSLLSQISQVITLDKPVPGTTQIVATLSKIGFLLDVTALSNIRIQARLNNVPVGPIRSVQSLLLSISLLDFNGSEPATVSFAPGVTYDGIAVTIGGVAEVLTQINIHEIGARTPITFTGGRVTGGIAGNAINSDIKVATANVGPDLPGFSIGCGTATDHTYTLYQVDQSGARTLGGTLPPSFALSPTGTLTGSPTLTQNLTYNFDIQATNSFGQTAVTPFIITIETNLPVTLAKFNAVAEGPTSLLSWSTSAETNSDRFEIERSQTGKNWSKIGTVSSKHESTSLNFYSFVDSKPLDGQNLYRLKMVDLDETFSYSHIENVNFSSSAYVYPNPVNGSENINFRATDWSKVKLVQVLNASGKTVFEASNALSSGINTRNLAAGFYFIKMLHTDGTTSTHKFVRQ